jgi:hypothetical protein
VTTGKVISRAHGHLRREALESGRTFSAAEAQKVVAHRLVAAGAAAIEKVRYHSPRLVSVQASLYEPAQVLGAGMFFHATPCLKAKNQSLFVLLWLGR